MRSTSYYDFKINEKYHVSLTLIFNSLIIKKKQIHNRIKIKYRFTVTSITVKVPTGFRGTLTFTFNSFKYRFTVTSTTVKVPNEFRITLTFIFNSLI